jgi:AcrR family transcriptional regulator
MDCQLVHVVGIRHDATVTEPADSEKKVAILDAALEKFSAYGFARTSMADIATAAGMSRPSLYQHYGNKEEIFRAMLGRILEDAADKALLALASEADLADRLDGFLQRWYGDLTERLWATEHGADLVEAKAGYAKPVADTVNRRVRKAVRGHLAARAAADVDVVALVDLLLLSPIGFKYDDPSVARLRRRLRTLATSVAGAVEPPVAGPGAVGVVAGSRDSAPARSSSRTSSQ